MKTLKQKLIAVAAILIVTGLGTLIAEPTPGEVCAYDCHRHNPIKNCSGSSGCVQFQTEELRACLAACPRP